MPPTIQFINISPEEFMANIIEQVKSNLPKPVAENNDLMTFKETMEFLKASRSTIQKYVRDKKLKCWHFEKTMYFKKSEILESLVLEKVKD